MNHLLAMNFFGWQLLFIYIFPTQAFQQYAKPLSFPAPQSEPFVFELSIQLQLSMSYMSKAGEAQLVNYSPATRTWTIRNNDMSLPCNVSAPLNDTAELGNVAIMDGLHRTFLAINGISPGQPIVVPFGSEVVMNVKNSQLSESITIHVHGMSKKNLWYTDGVAFLQQCPIPVGSSYSYRFIADTPGTMWFHGHMGVNRAEGLLGAFIVASGNERVVVDAVSGATVLPSRQYVAVVQSQLQQSVQELYFNSQTNIRKWQYGYDSADQCFAPTLTYDMSNVGGSRPASSVLVNDKGWHNQTEVLTSYDSLILETFNISAGEKILMRFINAGTVLGLMIAVDGHQMTVVAADGAPIKPVVADLLIISSGERYDVLIEGKASPKQRHYYITVETLDHFQWNFVKRPPVFGLAKFEYDHTSIVDPSVEKGPDFEHSNCTLSQPCLVLNCPFKHFPSTYPYRCTNADELRSLTAPTNDDVQLLSDQAFPDAAYQEHFINFNDHVNGWYSIPPNGVPYYYHGREGEVMPRCDPDACPEKNCPCFFYLNITLGKVVQLVIYNMAKGDRGSQAPFGFSHPVHIHGTHFYLMKTGYPDYNATTGFTGEPNADIPCSQSATPDRCDDLQWTNSSWLNGRVSGMNTLDPSSRDTVLVPAGGYVVLRFRADNPGWFYAHCHIMMHHLTGMSFALRIGVRSQMPPPPDSFPHGCGVYVQPPLNSTAATEETTTTPPKSSATTTSISNKLCQTARISLTVFILLSFML